MKRVTTPTSTAHGRAGVPKPAPNDTEAVAPTSRDAEALDSFWRELQRAIDKFDWSQPFLINASSKGL
jgi:hypothetical protein